MRKLFLAAVFLPGLLFALYAGAAPVWGQQYVLPQPDGSKVTVRVWGDEFYRVMETLDGYTVVRDTNTGYLCYALVSADGRRLESTGEVAGSPVRGKVVLTPHARISREASSDQSKAVRAVLESGRKRFIEAESKQAGRKAEVVGTVRGLCLLVDFSDDAASVPASDIDNFCNQAGYTGHGNNGSVRDYFYDVSNGALTYTTFVSTAYYRAAHPRTYYEDNSPEGVRASELILEALQSLDGQGHDFSQYDSDGDGYIDAINCFYAGTRLPDWGVGLWPHSGYLFGFSADGVSSMRYQITDIAAYPTLGTYCHENGHMIGDFPDLYDYGSESNGVGVFCLMGYGAVDLNPVEPCAYLKSFAGWSGVTDLDFASPQSGVPLVAGSNAIFRIPNPVSANEFFMIENRQAAGRDVSLPASGLALWHVDTLGSNDNEQMLPDQHYLVTLVQADGLWQLEQGTSYGDPNDLYRSGVSTECGPTTNPNTQWWDGNPSMARIFSISASANTMTFDFGPPATPLFSVLPGSIDRSIVRGSSPVSDTIQVLNGCPTPVSYTLSVGNASQAGLFAVDPAGGVSAGASVSHTLTYDVGGLLSGDYTATLTLDAVAANTPIQVPLRVSVVPSLADALDYGGVTWAVAGAGNWSGVNMAGAFGGDAAQSGIIGDVQESSLRAEIQGPASVQFDWRVSSEAGYDFLRFLIDGVEQSGKISGETVWTHRSFSVAAGVHLLEWVYGKDAYVREGEDAGWVDRVEMVDETCVEGPCPAGPPLGYLPGEPVCLSVPCPLWGADTFVWSKNGVPLADDTRISGSHERTLHIDAADYGDEGHYTCAYSRGVEPVGVYAATVAVVESLPAVRDGVLAFLVSLLVVWSVRRIRKATENED